MVDRPRMCGRRTRVCYGRTTRGFLFWISWAQQKLSGGYNAPCRALFPPFSLVQNRTDDFSASFSSLRCSALHPPPQCTASVLASTCFSTELVLLLSHIWAVYGRFGMFPASLKYMRGPPQWILSDSESIFEIQMVSYFFESEVKCQNPREGKRQRICLIWSSDDTVKSAQGRFSWEDWPGLK